MGKIIAISVLAAMSSSAMAHQCDINVDGHLQLENSVLTITTEQKDKITIDENKSLFVNGQSIYLDAEQQQWVDDYYDGINNAVPQVADIAVEGISLASEAISHVFGELLGHNNSAVDDLTAKLDEMNQQIQYNFYANDGSIRLDSNEFENGNFFGEQWENEFEEAVEELVFSSMGRLMIAIGSEMVMSGGDMSSFEERMENFAADIEEKVEFRGEELERKADQLCAQLVNVDVAENALQSSVDELHALNILKVNDQHNAL